MEKREIQVYKRSKDRFISEVLTLVNKLTENYGFYYCERLILINDIINVVKKNKNTNHKFNLYVDTFNNIFFVIYTKKFIDIYVCEEFREDNIRKLYAIATNIKKTYNLARFKYEQREEQEIINSYRS